MGESVCRCVMLAQDACKQRSACECLLSALLFLRNDCSHKFDFYETVDNDDVDHEDDDNDDDNDDDGDDDNEENAISPMAVFSASSLRVTHENISSHLN